MLRFCAGLFALLLFVCPSLAQSTGGGTFVLKGKVIDAQSKEPLTGVSVRVPGTQMGTTTGSDGNFRLSVAQPVDSLTYSFIGYQVTTLPFPQAGGLIRLTPSLAQLNSVIVSASREAQLRTDAPVAISTLSPLVLSETKATSLEQVLNKVSGVYMVDLGNEQHSMAIRQPISTRSLFLYLEDGIPIRTSGDFNHNALIEINQASLKTVEVIRGPASSLYGSEAIGGAVNFITQAPAAVPTATVQAEAGSGGYRRTRLQASATKGKLGLVFGGEYAGQRNGLRQHSDYDKLALTLRADYQLGERTRLVNSASLIDYQTDQTGGLDSAFFFGKQYASQQTFTYRKVNALRVRSTLEHNWNGQHRTQLTLFLRRNEIGQNPFYAIRSVAGNPLKARGEINRDRFNSYGLIAQHRKSFAFLNGSVIGGVSVDYSPATYQARFINVDRSPEGIYTGYQATDSLLTRYAVDLLNTAAYGQVQVSPLERLKLLAALRYDRMDYTFDNALPPSSFTGAPDERNAFSNWSPKVGATFDFGRDIGSYANYSVGFAPPQITELYRGVQVPSLESATYQNYELGGWISFAGRKGYLDASVYQLNGTNEIISVRLDDGSFQNQNAGKTRHQGVEYTLRYAPLPDVSFRVSGANARHRFVEYVERGSTFNGKQMATAPVWIANAEVILRPRFAPGLRLSTEWQHVGRYYMDAANSESYTGYDLLNLRAGYTWKGLEIWCNVLNVTNELYATTVDKSAFGKSYRPGNPRTVNLGIAYHWNGSR